MVEERSRCTMTAAKPLDNACCIRTTLEYRPWVAGDCERIGGTCCCGASPPVRSAGTAPSVHTHQADPQVDPCRRAAYRRRPDAPGTRRAGPLAGPAGA